MPLSRSRSMGLRPGDQWSVTSDQENRKPKPTMHSMHPFSAILRSGELPRNQLITDHWQLITG